MKWDAVVAGKCKELTGSGDHVGHATENRECCLYGSHGSRARTRQRGIIKYLDKGITGWGVNDAFDIAHRITECTAPTLVSEIEIVAEVAIV